jgi:hypothetical protein
MDFENGKLYWEYKINDRKLKFIFKEHLIKKNFMEVRVNDEEISTVLITAENINNFYMDVLLNIL